MANEDYDVPQAYVFCQKNVQTKGKITYYPIYMITFFEQIQSEEKVYKFDLTNHEREAMNVVLQYAKQKIDERFHPDGYNVGINGNANTIGK